MKTIQINGKEVVCHHEIKTDERHQTALHLTATVGDVKIGHAMTIGSVSEPLPEHYDSASLQKDLDIARENLARRAEGKHRAKLIAGQVE